MSQTTRARRFGLLVFLVVPLLAWSAGGTPAMTVDERNALDLSAYRVTDPDAGYFDVSSRREELAQTTDNLLLRHLADLRKADQCPGSRQLAPVQGDAVIPRFHEDRDGWRLASAPYLAFEDMVGKLAAQHVVAPESGARLCLLEMLERWAEAGAFLKVDARQFGLQSWFQAESSLFGAALAYAIVREDQQDFGAQRQRIEEWLVAAARNHMRYAGGKDGTCCNNHFYRRALYATIIGVLTADDDLFRIGVSAVYSALSDAAPSGALRLEMSRGEFAARYQVYAAMHLVMIARIAARQGYDLFALEYGGRSLDEVVDFAVAAMLAPETVALAADSPGQDVGFLEGGAQYYAWLELLAGRPRWDAAAQALLASVRPVYNRGLGGYLTLYFLPARPSP